jgi:hypothetical protein
MGMTRIKGETIHWKKGNASCVHKRADGDQR